MDNKIYNAIQRQLIIDSDDSSINYHKSDADADFVIKPSLEDIYDIFKNNPTDIFKYDLSKCFTLITDDDQEIPLNEYINYNLKKLIFLKISNSDLKETGNDMLICIGTGKSPCRGHMVKSNVKWVEKHGLPAILDTDKTDLAGYDNSISIYEYADNAGYHIQVPAINYCMSKSRKTNNSTVYIGYLPAIGQLMILSKYLDLINYILSAYLRGEWIDLNNDWWHSSSEYSDQVAWHLGYGEADCYGRKTYPGKVLPLFKKVQS